MAVRTRTIVQQFLRFVSQTRAPLTHAYYQHHLAKLTLRVGNKIAARLRPIDLTSWAKTWHETQAVQRCFTWAATEANLLRKSPFSRVRRPAMRGRERTLTPREIVRFLRAMRPAPRLFFLAMRETLARPQEIRSARWCDLRAENPRESLARS